MILINCPVCQLQLQACVYEGKLVGHCPNCLGHWLRKAVLQHVIATRIVPLDRAAAAKLAKAAPDRTIPHVELTRVLECPECKTPLEPRKFADDSPIVVNRCADCEGVWLDRQELERVQMLIEAIDDTLGN